MSTEVQNTTSSQHDAKLLVMCRALLDAIEAEHKEDYSAIDESWQWAMNEMSDAVIEAWNEKTKAINKCADELRRYLSEHGT
jgi:hypothetical protein